MSNPNINDKYDFWDCQEAGKVTEAYITKLKYLRKQIDEDIRRSEMNSYPEFYQKLGYLVSRYIGKDFSFEELEKYLMSHSRKINEEIYHLDFEDYEGGFAYLFHSYEKDKTYRDSDYVINSLDELKVFFLKASENPDIAQNINFDVEPWCKLLRENNPHIRTDWFELNMDDNYKLKARGRTADEILDSIDQAKANGQPVSDKDVVELVDEIRKDLRERGILPRSGEKK